MKKLYSGKLYKGGVMSDYFAAIKWTHFLDKKYSRVRSLCKGLQIE
ncbi:hypothetical protein [Marinomonas colpomeniae]|uniref:Uncharacterized protein n=1 Tax=Marinomonas colpomeniae TaxID=2774408 RepID=A0ABR8NXT3_9GAMM|nr:hypothetical protein [Marinomonas colpomeniae]MBD5770840.1 hypothetical protein [Marinomonas colpomeniae]